MAILTNSCSIKLLNVLHTVLFTSLQVTFILRFLVLSQSSIHIEFVVKK